MSTNYRVITAAAAVMTLAAASTPAAAAGPTDARVTTATQPAAVSVYSRQDKAVIPVASRSTFTDGVSAGQAVVQIQPPPSGFAWDDAAVGAVGGFALSMIGLGGVLVVSQRRARGPIRPHAPRAK
jgi:hypothetical protein